MSFLSVFHSPWALALLPFPFLLAFWRTRLRRGRALKYSSVRLFGTTKPTVWTRLSLALPWVRAAALACLIVALARPREGMESQEVISEGVDIVLALDLSGSMQALDLVPQKTLRRFAGMDAETFAKREWPKHSRLGVAKSVVADFVSKRPHDRIGLVGFAGEAQTLCPLTLDHGILREMLDAANHETVPVNGTAIGDALMNSIRRLDRSKAPSKVVVLLTDGVHNAGSVHPAQAAAVAKTLGVRIHAIGVGKRSGTQLRPAQNPFTGALFWQETPISAEDRVDEASLQEVARTTGGLYFRATDGRRLGQIYDEIDKMEKSEIRTRTFTKYRELYRPWLLLGAILLLGELLLGRTRLLRAP